MDVEDLANGEHEHIFIEAPRKKAQQFALGLFEDVSDHDEYEYDTLYEATHHHRAVQGEMSVGEFTDLPSVLVVNSDEVDRRLN